MKTRTAIKAFILMILLCFVSIRPCFTQTVGTSKPGIIVEQEAGKTIAHLTIPGTKVRDYTKPSFILEKSGDTLVAYPTLPGTSVRDYAKQPITFDTKRSEITSDRPMRSAAPTDLTPSVPTVVHPFQQTQEESLDAYSTRVGSFPAVGTKQNQSAVASESVLVPQYKPLPTPGTTTALPQNDPSTLGAVNLNRYNPNSLANPYGAGSPYKTDGLLNPYSKYGSPYSPNSWNNPYATDTPRLVDQSGNYRGKLSVNPYDPDSVSNPYGRYGSRYSPDSINNPFGAGNPYSTTPIYVVKPKR